MFKIHQKSCPSHRIHKLGRDFSFLSLFDHRIGGNFYLGTFEMSKIFCFSKSNKAKAKPVWWCAFPFCEIRSVHQISVKLFSVALVRVFQKYRTNRIHVFVYKEIYCKELAFMTMESETLQDGQSARWKPCL